VIKPAEHARRRNEFLDSAQRLVQAKGYERMTVQDVLDDLQASKGALYHYFDSKQALLAALVDRLSREAEALVAPLARDPYLAALEKLRRFFPTLAGWKTEQREFLLALLRVWYADDNAIVRQKTRTAVAARITPLLAAIIAQGVEEHDLTTPDPDIAADVVVALVQDLNDSLGRMVVAYEPGRDVLALVQRTVAGFSDALERVVGAPPGALPLAEPATFTAWFGRLEGPTA
jgi:AcrR family transcriptional regulator